LNRITDDWTKMYRKSIKKFTAVAGTLALAGVLGACSGGAGGASDSEVVKVGVVLPLTGPAAFFGPIQRDGIELRLKEAGGKAGGKQIELIMIDSGADLGTALPRVKQLVERDGVSVIIGPLQSDLLAGLLPYYTQQEIPAVSLLNHPREFADHAPYLFTPQGALAEGSKPMGHYAATELGVETVTVQAHDYAAGRDIAGGFIEAFAEAGGEVVQEQYSPISTSDFGQYIANLDTTADALATWNVGTAQNFMAEYVTRDQLENTLLMYGDALTESQLNEIGDSSVGWHAPLSYTWRLDTPESQKFVEAVRDEYDREPVAQIDEGAYEALSLIIQALEETDGDASAERLVAAMREIELQTPAGPVRFDEQGYGIRNVYILESQRTDEGTIGWVPVKTYGPEGD
jgi:branched-chain amino acid transport system substrate-binding protein